MARTRSRRRRGKRTIISLSHGQQIFMYIPHRSMASLLTKFRIKYSELIMLKGVTDPPRHDTMLKHKRLIEPFRRSARNEFGITDDELHSMAEKTQRQLRIHELVVKHSSNASLVVMSLPMPRKVSSQTTAALIVYLMANYFNCRRLYRRRCTCPG